MKHLLQLIFILSAYTASAQNFSGQAYSMGREHSQAECKIVAKLDTCSADFVFLSRKKFIMITHCGDSESLQGGKYIVKDKKLKLEFSPNVVMNEPDKKTGVKNLTKQNLIIVPIEYDISVCSNGEVWIQFSDHKIMSYGSRHSESHEAELINNLKKSEAYKLLTE